MAGGPGSNKSTTSTSSSSSGSVSAKAKSRRQTIATLAAAAAAQKPASSPAPNPSQSSTTLELQRNLVALATQIGLNKAAAAAAAVAAEPIQQQTAAAPATTTSFDQIIQEMTMNGEKAKLLSTNTPKVHGTKHFKKQHLLSASLSASPNTLTQQANGAATASPVSATGTTTTLVTLPGQKPPKGKRLDKIIRLF